MALDAEVLIVGGGISGLGAAWGLQQRGHDVLLIESAARVGGAIGSTRVDGCLIESGPNSTLETSPLIGALIEETGILDERIYANPEARNRFVLRDGELIPVPLSPPAFLRTPLFSWRTKLGLAWEPFVRRAHPEAEETVAQFVRRRLGREFLDYAINPFVAGVYAGDPARLSVRAAFPRLFELEQKYGGLIRGQILGARERKRNPEKSKQAAPMLSFREGMQTLTDAIAARLKRVAVSTRATGLARLDGGGWEVTADSPTGGKTYRARQAVLAVPAFTAAHLLKPLAPEAAKALETIIYPPVAAVVSAYSRAQVTHPLNGFGFLIPEKEHRKILGTIFSSTLFANRAPGETALLTTFVGGMRQPELAGQDEHDIASMVAQELDALLGVTGQPRWTRVARWDRAIPQYTIGHLGRMATLEAAETALPGLYFCANYRNGISVADCIKSAHAMAERVAAAAR